MVNTPSQHSRPKVHRLPALPRQERVEHPLVSAILSYGDTARLIFVISSVVCVLLLLGLFTLRSVPTTFSKSETSATIAPASEPGSEPKTIELRNDQDKIIGQMAKISSPVSPGVEVSTVITEADKRKGQELLSIIGKY